MNEIQMAIYSANPSSVAGWFCIAYAVVWFVSPGCRSWMLISTGLVLWYLGYVSQLGRFEIQEMSQGGLLITTWHMGFMLLSFLWSFK